MKSWNEFREQQSSERSGAQIQESRLVRKGLGLVYGAQARAHGNSAEKHYREASQTLSGVSKDGDINKKLRRLETSLTNLADGLIDTRKQLGAMTAMMNVMILLEERTDQHLKKLSRKR